jgi:hypothetical protein
MNRNDDQYTKGTPRKGSLWVRLILSLGVVLLLDTGMIVNVQGQGDTAGKGVPALTGKPQGKLSFRLELLAQPTIGVQNAATQARVLSLPASGPGSLLRNEDGEILVYIRLADVSATNLQALTDAGAKIVHTAEAYRTVTAYISFDRLVSVTSVAAVESVHEELTPQIAGVTFRNQDTERAELSISQAQADCGPATTSEGDIQLKADLARITYGLDGTGVIVGVLSDSYNNPSQPQYTNAAMDIASGDLPGPGNPCGCTTPVNVIKEGPQGTDEGRAMLQIVHDLAPEADLAFASGMYGIFDMADEIRALWNNAGTNVIADDITYYVEPFFQDGPVSVAIQEVTANGVLYSTAAGNSHVQVGGNAIASYEASAYRPMACPAIPAITQGNCHDFNPTAGTDNRSSFTLASGGTLAIDFQWAEPWYGVQTDLDIYLVDDSNNILAVSSDSNPIVTQTPSEYFSYTNNTGAAQTVYLVINRYSGTVMPRLKYILPMTFGLTAVEYNASNSTDTFGPTVFGHSGANEAISVAAVPYDDSNTPEDFTSRGFPTYYFGPVTNDTPAAPLATPETRQKPDVAATDGGRNTFFGSFTGGVYRFYGTSASAPHGAAVAALMRQQANQLSRTLNQPLAELILETTASAIFAGSPQANGAGLINALAATNGTNYPFSPQFEIYFPMIMKNY